MSATLQAIVNGGPPQTGGIDVADGDVVQLTAASKVGWGNPATRWEIYDHPDGFAPAGWTADPGGVGFYFVGSADPPSFTMDGDLWGKYLTRVTGPDGKPDESTILCLPSPIGLRGIARRESGQFGGDTRLWLGEYNRDLRAISTLVNPASEATEIPLTLDHNFVTTVSSSADPFVLQITQTGHKEGMQGTYKIPAGNRTSIILAPGLNVQGDLTVDSVGVVTGFDSGFEWKIVATYTADGFITIARKIVATDVVAPTVVSATVTGGNPNALSVVLSKRVNASSLTGMSMPFSVGTARTITAVESGQGTSTVVLTLSDNLAGTETCSFVLAAGNHMRSLNGVSTTPSTTPVTLSFGPADTVTGAIHLWRGDSRTLSGSDVLTVIDQIGSADMTSGATKPTITTLGTLAAPAMQLTAGDYLTTGVIAAETMTSGSINMIFRIVTGADRAFVVGGNGTTFEALNYAAGGGASLLAASDNAQTGGLSAAWSPGTGIHSVCFTWDPSGREQYLDNALHDSDTTDATTPTITKWVIGALLDLATLSGGTLIIGEVQVGNTHLANGTEIHNIRASRYGT